MLAGSEGRIRRLIVVLGAALSVALAAPGMASAVEIGSAQAGDVSQCGGEDLALGQYSTEGNEPSYRVPFDGVITSWSYDNTAPPSGRRGTAAASLKLKVFRVVGNGEFLVVGESDPEQLEDEGINTFPTNISVQAGDFIGFTVVAGSAPGCADETENADDIVAFGADDPPGSPWQVFGGENGLRLNIAANVESSGGSRGCDQTEEGCPQPPPPGCNPGWSYVETEAGDPRDKNGDGFVCKRRRSNDNGVDTTDNYIQGGTTSCNDPELCGPQCRGLQQCREASPPQRTTAERATPSLRSRRAARRAKARKIRAARRAMRSYRHHSRAHRRARARR